MDVKEINYMGGCLWGESGGRLEYVSQRTIYKLTNGEYIPYMIIRFTDHDVQMTREGEDMFYDLEFPLWLTTVDNEE